MSTDNCQPGFYCLCEWGFGTCTAVTDNDAGGFDFSTFRLFSVGWYLITTSKGVLRE